MLILQQDPPRLLPPLGKLQWAQLQAVEPVQQQGCLGPRLFLLE